MINKPKKASIPVTLLVLLTIAICIFALISFSASNRKNLSKVEEYSILEKAYIISDFSKNSWAPTAEYYKADYDNISIDNGKVTAEKYKKKSWIPWSKEKVKVFEIAYTP